MVVYLLKNSLGVTRLGITTSKKIGGAVERNRARRILREAANACIAKDLGYDVVLVARADTTKSKSTILSDTLEELLIKIQNRVDTKNRSNTNV